MIGKTILELTRVDSTNTYVRDHQHTAQFRDGTVIWAREQFAGRGQDRKSWSSEAGKNLTFTVYLEPVFLEASRQFLLNKAITLGILDFIRSFALPMVAGPVPVTAIKWPNDLYINHQKVGGILIENTLMGDRLASSVVGIGINVNQTRFAPDLPNPVSLIHLLRHETVLEDALLAVCHALNSRYEQLKGSDPEAIGVEFDLNLLGYDQWSDFRLNGQMLRGRICGVDPVGMLMVEDEQGTIRHYMHKEIELLTDLPGMAGRA